MVIVKNVGIWVVLMAAMLVGCQAPTGEQHQANVYRADQVNQRQEAKTVQILAVMPARIEVSNESNRQTAQVGGAVLGALLAAAAANQTKGEHRKEATVAGAVAGGAGGAALGSMVKETVLVDGVSLTYVEDGKTLNSAQVGRVCEYQPGLAVVIATSETETRIQPNASCPVAEVRK